MALSSPSGFRRAVGESGDYPLPYAAELETGSGASFTCLVMMQLPVAPKSELPEHASFLTRRVRLATFTCQGRTATIPAANALECIGRHGTGPTP